MKKYYIIKVYTNDYSTDNKGIYETLEEAESHIMSYADWYSSNGTCRILTVNNEFTLLEERWYESGKLKKTRKYKK